MTAERSIDDLLADLLAERQKVAALLDRIARLHTFAADLSLENFRLLGQLVAKQRSITALEAVRDELVHSLLHETVHLSPTTERFQ